MACAGEGIPNRPGCLIRGVEVSPNVVRKYVHREQMSGSLHQATQVSFHACDTSLHSPFSSFEFSDLLQLSLNIIVGNLWSHRLREGSIVVVVIITIGASHLI